MNFLYEENNENLDVIDKLPLAMLKAFNKKTVVNWLNEKKEFLKQMNTVTEEAIIEIREKYGEAVAPKNMYLLCKDKINSVSKIIEENGILYNDFESAIELYKSEGYIELDKVEIQEFNSIMEFVYLGRKSISNNKLKNLNKYILS